MIYTNNDSLSSSSTESTPAIEELQPSTSSSSSSVSSPLDPPAVNSSSKQALSCAICGGATSCRHFGAVSCNACAAFFRRTIAEKRTYSCSHHGNCTLISELVRRMCRHCRFKKCLKVGMQESEVLSLGSAGKQKPPIKDGKVKREPLDSFSYIPQQESEGSVVARRSAIVRFDHNGRYYGFGQDDISRLDPNCVSFLPTTSMTVLQEVKVFHAFIKSSGLAEYIDAAEIQNNIVPLTQAWNITQMIMNTLHFDGNVINRIYFIDHTYMPVTERGIIEWYTGDKVLRKDPYFIVRMSTPLWIRTKEVVKHLKEANFTPTEKSIFVTLTMVNFIINLCGNIPQMKHRLTPFMNQIFKSMRQYYADNLPSEDYGCRMGRIMMLLPLCTDINNMTNEHRQQLLLLGRKMDHYLSSVVLNKAIEQFKTDEISIVS